MINSKCHNKTEINLYHGSYIQLLSKSLRWNHDDKIDTNIILEKNNEKGLDTVW